MINWIQEMFAMLLSNNWVIFWLFFIPLVIASVGAIIKTLRETRKDYLNRKAYESGKASWFDPKVTVGTILGRVILCLCPIANIFYALYLLFSEILEEVVTFLSEVFDKPLIKKRERNVSKEE